MGWTGTTAIFYKYKNGRQTVDTKAECDALWSQDHSRFKVLKSAMVGSTYYAAIQICKKWKEGAERSPENLVDIPEEEREVFGEVILTSVNMKDFFNFSYKDIPETMGPCEDHCPMSIIKLLTPTTSEWANQWRDRCREYAKSRNSPNNPNKLPIGTKIKFTNNRGEEIILVKRSPAYQFKTPWWYEPSSGCYCSKKRLPKEFEIIEEGVK